MHLSIQQITFTNKTCSFCKQRTKVTINTFHVTEQPNVHNGHVWGARRIVNWGIFGNQPISKGMQHESTIETEMQMKEVKQCYQTDQFYLNLYW